MRRSLIVARSVNNVIGKDGKIPWALPSDLARFKRLTMNRPIIMGRETFLSLPSILPGRKHAVLSRSLTKSLPFVSVFSDVHTSLAWAEEIEHSSPSPEAFFIGGSQVYDEVLQKDLVDRAYVTQLSELVEGDRFFCHRFTPPEWLCSYEEEVIDNKTGVNYVNHIYDRQAFP